MNKRLCNPAVLVTRLLVLVVLGLHAHGASAEPLRTVTDDDDRDINDVIQKMTVREKIGQLLVLGFQGDLQHMDEAVRAVEHFHAGGIILFEHNVPGMREARPDDRRVAEHVAELVNALQDLASGTPRGLPLLVAADQEGGSAIVIEKGVTLLPGAMAIAATGKPDYALQAGRITGHELRAMGITMSLAPVVDINTDSRNDIIGDRSFGASRVAVADYAAHFMKGLRSEGLLSVAKHFPGHGFTHEDPHKTLPTALYTPQQVEEFLIYPYRELIPKKLDGIMPAHIAFPQLGLETDKTPFSLSQKAISEWIRNKLGFDGVVISDDLAEMKAARLGAGNSVDRAILEAARAGNDMLVLVSIPPDLDQVVAALENYFGQGDRPAQLDRSVRRVLRLKKKVRATLHAAAWKVVPEAVVGEVRRDADVKIATEIANHSITKIFDHSRLFDGEHWPMQQVEIGERILVCAPVYSTDDLSKQFTKRNREVETVVLPYRDRWDEGLFDQKEREIDAALARAPKLVVFGFVTPEHVRLLSHLLKGVDAASPKPKMLVIAFRAPNLLESEDIKRVTYIAAYSNLAVSNEAVGRVLFGETFGGERVRPARIESLPVSIPEVWHVPEALPAVAVAPPPTPPAKPIGANGRETSPVRPRVPPVDLWGAVLQVCVIVLLAAAVTAFLARVVFSKSSLGRDIIVFIAFTLVLAVGATATKLLDPAQLGEIFGKALHLVGGKLS